MFLNPFAKRLKILCSSIGGDIVKGSDADRIMDWDSYNPSIRALVTVWRVPPQDQVITSRPDVSKPANVD